MLFAAIDVGTNSIHLIVVECDSIYDSSRVVYKARDVRHLGVVNDVSVRRENGRIVLAAQAETDVSGELAAAMLKADLFERVFQVRLAIEAQPAELRA